MFHKADVSKIIDDSDLFNMGAEISDKFGAFLVGAALTAYAYGLSGVNNSLAYAGVTVVLLIGMLLTAFGVCLKYQRKKKIDDFLAKKLKEAQN